MYIITWCNARALRVLYKNTEKLTWDNVICEWSKLYDVFYKEIMLEKSKMDDCLWVNKIVIHPTHARLRFLA